MQQQQRQRRQREQQKSPGGCLLVLILVLITLGALVSGIHLSNLLGSSFNAQAEALQLALNTQQYRNRHKSATKGFNLGQASIILEYPDGTFSQPDRSPIYLGMDSPPPDVNKDHSERKEHEQFILPTLSILARKGTLDKVSMVHIVLFSQIYVCLPCQSDMRGWLDHYRCIVGPANANKLDVTVWELTGGFNTKAPLWTVVANEEDVQPVSIAFNMSSDPCHPSP
jgi:hypothetical protein